MRAREFITEAFNQPYSFKWEAGEHGDYDALATLGDGTYLSIMFNNEGDNEWQVEFHRNNSQAVTGEGDAQRIFATVLTAIQQFIQKQHPDTIIFSASKDVEQGQSSESRAKLYDRLVQRYATAWGYNAYNEDHGDQVTYELTRKNQTVAESSKNQAISFTVQKAGNRKFATTMLVDGKPAGLYQYDSTTGRSIAEMYPKFKGKGLGKILVLHAIYTAAMLGMNFQEDESRTAEYDNVLDSLSSNGYIVDDDGYWYVTGEGEEFLQHTLKQDVAEDEEPVIKLSNNGRERAKAWIEKVYELYPSTFQGNHVMMWGTGEDQQLAMFELVPSMSKRGAVEVKWFQAYPLRAGVGSRAMKELQRLAHEDGIQLTLYPWDKGQVSQAKLMKFYKGQGFKPTMKGSKNMYWEPAAKELTELFDPGTALPLEWERMPGPSIQGVKSKDDLYATAYDNDGRTININFVPMRNGIVDISFNRGGSMDITGKGSAAQIFATVVDAINKYIKAEHPGWISFSASEPSRAKLYQHMVKRLSGSYELLSPDQYPASEDLENAQLGVGQFFLLRKK
jgi:hypothetical protein